MMKIFAGPTSRRAASIRLITIATMVVMAGALAACKDLTSVDASFDNVTDSLDFYTLNNSPPGTATAINLFSGNRFRADETFAYDIAFDIDSENRVLVIPSRALATGLSAPYSVGLQKLSGVTFAQVTDAPKTGYRVDTALVATVGSVVAIESHDAATCGLSIKGSSYFSKLVITQVDLVDRKISIVLEVNRNCGFHSFAEGKPKD
jgi:hypothetical protein